jgi:hypothetical protein
MGWLRQEATLAEAEKKALDALQKSENGGSNVNDPLTAAMLPGMDPSTMMVRDNAIRRGDVNLMTFNRLMDWMSHFLTFLSTLSWMILLF